MVLVTVVHIWIDEIEIVRSSTRQNTRSSATMVRIFWLAPVIVRTW